jgi:hypothetical protein
MKNFPSANRLADLSVFIQFAVQFLPSSGTFVATAQEACSPGRLPEAKTFFQERGYDGATITCEFLERCAVSAGWHKQVLKPQRTFADMLECLKQHQQGLVTDGELLLVVQMVPHQVQAVITYNNLPLKLLNTVNLTDWDESISVAAERGLPPCGTL